MIFKTFRKLFIDSFTFYISFGSGASGTASFAEGSNTTASGDASHAEGYFTITAGAASHAEGYSTKASGNFSHAEGNYTESSGNSSHAEGDHATASGSFSHAEGKYTTASGFVSHAGGHYTIAGYDNQTAIGAYNNNLSDTLFEVGNGINGARSNAIEIYSNGRIHAPALSTSLITDNRCLVTKEYLFSPEFGSSLPTTDPQVNGKLWNNGGVVAISSSIR